MPHIRVRNLSDEQMMSLSETLITPLAEVIKTGEDNFTLEKISSRFFEKGREIASYPFIEILWFARSSEVQDRAALLVTEQVKKLTGAPDVAVVFQELAPGAYYENGEHF